MPSNRPYHSNKSRKQIYEGPQQTQSQSPSFNDMGREDARQIRENRSANTRYVDKPSAGLNTRLMKELEQRQRSIINDTTQQVSRGRQPMNVRPDSAPTPAKPSSGTTPRVGGQTATPTQWAGGGDVLGNNLALKGDLKSQTIPPNSVPQVDAQGRPIQYEAGQSGVTNRPKVGRGGEPRPFDGRGNNYGFTTRQQVNPGQVPATTAGPINPGPGVHPITAAGTKIGNLRNQLMGVKLPTLRTPGMPNMPRVSPGMRGNVATAAAAITTEMLMPYLDPYVDAGAELLAEGLYNVLGSENATGYTWDEYQEMKQDVRDNDARMEADAALVESNDLTGAPAAPILPSEEEVIAADLTDVDMGESPAPEEQVERPARLTQAVNTSRSNPPKPARDTRNDKYSRLRSSLNKNSSKKERDTVRDAGLAQHKELFPHLYN